MASSDPTLFESVHQKAKPSRRVYARQDLSGMRFGKIVLLRHEPSKVTKIGARSYWWGVCDCDPSKERLFLAANLKSGETKTCGCGRVAPPRAPMLELVGQKYGKLTVVSLFKRVADVDGGSFWNARCDCNPSRIIQVRGKLLRDGGTKSCGCSRRMPRPIRRKDISGKRYGFIEVVQYSHQNKFGDSMFLCWCNRCKDWCVCRAQYLKNGMAISCGCFRKQRLGDKNRTHGQAHSPLHRIWAGMKSRCGNPNGKAYHHYGGRGITVCDQWVDNFEAFRDYMGPRPPGASLDRIDSNRGYMPGNVRWADKSTQMQNRRTAHFITHQGETKNLSAWAAIAGVCTSTILKRLVKGQHILASRKNQTPKKPKKLGNKRFGIQNIRHGGCGTPEYSSWTAMKDRCLNPKCDAYPLYGGRGIAIYGPWIKDFSAFRTFLGDRPNGMTLDRISSDGNYEPGNVRWATPTTQCENRRIGHQLTHNGESHSMAGWAKKLSVTPSTILRRLQEGKTMEQVLGPNFYSLSKEQRKSRSQPVKTGCGDKG